LAKSIGGDNGVEMIPGKEVDCGKGVKIAKKKTARKTTFPTQSIIYRHSGAGKKKKKFGDLTNEKKGR